MELSNKPQEGKYRYHFNTIYEIYIEAYMMTFFR